MRDEGGEEEERKVYSVSAVNCSQISHNNQNEVELWLRCMMPGLLAYLSTAPERDCHWILPCGPLN